MELVGIEDAKKGLMEPELEPEQELEPVCIEDAYSALAGLELELELELVQE